MKCVDGNASLNEQQLQGIQTLARPAARDAKLGKSLLSQGYYSASIDIRFFRAKVRYYQQAHR